MVRRVGEVTRCLVFFILLYAVVIPMPVDAAERFYLEILGGKIIFNIAEPEIPRLYVISHQKEIGLVDTVQKQMMKNFAKKNADFSTVVCKKEGNKITYSNENYLVMLEKDDETIYYDNKAKKKDQIYEKYYSKSGG